MQLKLGQASEKKTHLKVVVSLSESLYYRCLLFSSS
jgi:hypothetical protein